MEKCNTCQTGDMVEVEGVMVCEPCQMPKATCTCDAATHDMSAEEGEVAGN